MARLELQAAVRWASGAAFPHVAMLVALAVSDEAGAAVDRITADEIRVGFQVAPEPSEDSTASISNFHHNGATFGGTGWYSFIVEPPSYGWVQDQVFLCVTVRHKLAAGGTDRGQVVLLATYHHPQ